LSIYEKSYTLGPVYKWRLEQYVSPWPNQRTAIEDWRKRLEPVAKSDFDTFLKNMAKRAEWHYPDIDGLRGKKYRGLSELRWISGNVQHRVIGYTLSDHHYLMLIGCTHKQRRYTPTSCLDSAAERRKRVERGEACYSEYPLITDRGTSR